jgi:hypothetical protein
MPRYKNRSGESGVIAYEAGKDHIIVQFIDGEKYLYSYKRPGKLFVERMKKLAAAGKGLSTFISVNVREKYEKKL